MYYFTFISSIDLNLGLAIIFNTVNTLSIKFLIFFFIDFLIIKITYTYFLIVKKFFFQFVNKNI